MIIVPVIPGINMIMLFINSYKNGFVDKLFLDEPKPVIGELRSYIEDLRKYPNEKTRPKILHLVFGKTW